MDYITRTSGGRIYRFSTKADAINEMRKYTGPGWIALYIGDIEQGVKWGNKSRIEWHKPFIAGHKLKAIKHPND